jgi:hypothetical protein
MNYDGERAAIKAVGAGLVPARAFLYHRAVVSLGLLIIEL